MRSAAKKGPNRSAVAEAPAPHTEKELKELRALQADIDAGRITERDGKSLEQMMEGVARKAGRMLRSRA